MLMLVIHFSDEYALALDIVKGFEPSTSWEYVLKAVIFACVGQQDNNVR